MIELSLHDTSHANLKLIPAMYASASLRVRLRPDGSAEPTGWEGKYTCRMHPQVRADLQGIRQPSVNFRQRCGVPETP